MHIGTPRDRFVKAMVKYHEVSNLITSLMYLPNYLIHYYKIEKVVAADIRLTILFLMISFKEKKSKIKEILISLLKKSIEIKVVQVLIKHQ